MKKKPVVICPVCRSQAYLEEVLTAQSNQNVIYACPSCQFMLRNIYTSKG
ncbi:hypothetical protein PNH38_10955 [Anoxybacillus rupiensis]|jgi:uncharacterized Zn finger protein|uniref:Uncharacterized protein n=1 Tax=Anoxybacteroides rupiense TaxID=311460 RepID=A0ABD5IR57_9BACL|nr:MULTISPECIES: hypothetical protein [Anoxybacillus]KXG10377.1 hypothetical protein AT864_00968 [Anoxybacillus sp. P3H1B]MBB3906339.1 putative Zn finger protein [Anoxybacillus rupiensis]MBS2770678.1 hypothetical protein [Anoxybacillus rupiensis]MDE8564395.1 hypothetical protein [Anoxybacillus rupiensis]MED5050319.1 hypothetical protein [Anoxybacillus rupiensis]